MVRGVRGAILWRSANPDLPEDERRELVRQLMKARRDVGAAKRAGADAAGLLAKMHALVCRAAVKGDETLDSCCHVWHFRTPTTRSSKSPLSRFALALRRGHGSSAAASG